MTISLTTQLAGRSFDSVVMNAAGVFCMTQEELSALAQSSAATFVTKTATLNARPGNPSPRYHDFGLNSINSMGLPNHGLQYYLDFLAQEADEDAQKRFLSISPLQTQDLSVLLTRIKEAKFKGLVELNLSCPNVPGKPQVAYDFAYTQQILTEAFSLYDQPLGVKMPPYFDLAHFDQMADILNQFPLAFINSINSIGNGLVIQGDQVSIAPKQGFGGLGGPMIKATALANVHAFYQRLRSDIQIIGTGGITTGRDIYEHILCGASLVQIGTCLHQEGLGAFDRLLNEFSQELAKSPYQSVAELRGQLTYHTI